MSLKTILVHLANDVEHRTRLKVALKLARQHDAKVFALFIPTPIGMPAGITGRGASAMFLSEASRNAREVADNLEKEFHEACERDGIENAWLVIEGDHVELMSEHAHTADIIIAAQPIIEHLEDHFRTRLPEELVMQSGLPVLVIPRGFDPENQIGKKVVLAWKGTREAVRAIRDSMTILASAEKVLVLTVGADAGDALSKLEVMEHLRRHGVNGEARNLAEIPDSVGKAILDFAETQGCDLIVLGAYGHTRWRQILLGGVTHEVLADSKIPLLMSH
ncbi:universal stress protein [Limibacillus sp. MBR-115]|jgi:nucleotide-binding universal stress UspA family protein|uniref:universal stress protein n=1 Tax=Limibacillus sp. MBR-115 TaxID=3156465 RepID=UPI0033999D5F